MKQPHIMNKQKIILGVIDKHQSFIKNIEPMAKNTFEDCPEGQWSVGQHLKHVILSVKPLNQGLLVPFFLLKLRFGKAERASRSYDEILSLYQTALKNGGKATGDFVPKKITFEEKTKLLDQLSSLLNSFTKKLNKLSERQLDDLLLPHPLIGKITLREMLYFSIYHVEHHTEIIQERKD